MSAVERPHPNHSNMKKIIVSLTLILSINVMAQDELPFYEVADYTDVSYTAGSVAARMVDGLGFRYRWATEDLREEDLAYKITDSSRTSLETIDHILGLSRVIVNATNQVPTDFTKQRPELTFEEKRKETLANLERASRILITAQSLEEFKIEFVFSGGESEYPFWNNINGPIADALWHCGQVTMLRRASGNPISSKVRFLQGKIGE